MTSEYINREGFEKILRYLTPSNALALEVSVVTGLRIGDVLKIQKNDIIEGVLTYTAEKTGKAGKKFIGKKLEKRLKANSQGEFVFPGRDPKKHRTRQAVYKNMQQSVAKLNLAEKVSPHSARKIYAVDLYEKGDIEVVRRELQHDNISTTLLYAFSDRKGKSSLTNSDIEQIKQVFREVLSEFLVK